jgi:hypothetical protein
VRCGWPHKRRATPHSVYPSSPKTGSYYFTTSLVPTRNRAIATHGSQIHTLGNSPRSMCTTQITNNFMDAHACSDCSFTLEKLHYGPEISFTEWPRPSHVLHATAHPPEQLPPGPNGPNTPRHAANNQSTPSCFVEQGTRNEYCFEGTLSAPQQCRRSSTHAHARSTHHRRSHRSEWEHCWLRHQPDRIRKNAGRRSTGSLEIIEQRPE